MRWLLVFASLGALVLGLFLAITFLAPTGSDGKQQRTFDAGSKDSFQAGSLRYFDSQHVYVVRELDGNFKALYDWDSFAQLQYSHGDSSKTACRAQEVVQTFSAYQGDLSAIHQRYAPVPGLENVVLREGCSGSSFDALGRRGFGPSAADLDRLPVSFDPHGHVIVDLSHRQCQANSPCLEPRPA